MAATLVVFLVAWDVTLYLLNLLVPFPLTVVADALIMAAFFPFIARGGYMVVGAKVHGEATAQRQVAH